MCCEDGVELTTLAQRIGYLRRCAGLKRGRDLTHTEIAAAFKVSVATVGSWEGVGTRKKGPHRDRIEAIARFYSVDPGWLLTGQGSPPSGAHLSFTRGPGVDVRSGKAAAKKPKRA